MDDGQVPVGCETDVGGESVLGQLDSRYYSTLLQALKRRLIQCMMMRFHGERLLGQFQRFQGLE